MNARHSACVRPSAVVLSILLAALLAPAVAGAAKPKPKIKLKVATTSQVDLFAGSQLRVEVKSVAPKGKKGKRGGKGKRARTAVRLGAAQGSTSGLVAKKRVKVRAGRSVTAKLKLTAKGESVLGSCGSQKVVVSGTFRSGKKKRTAKASRVLAADDGRCVISVDPPNPDRCDPIATDNCLLPFPNDFYTVADASTDTGRRVALQPASMPANTSGDRFDPAEYNRNDGFSPNSPIVTRIPGLDTDAAFAASGIVPQSDIAQYARADQPVVVINAETGERHPVWAEIDKVTDDPSQRTLIIRPAESFDYGTRYIVALRNLKGADGSPLAPSPVFAAYRDAQVTDNAAVEQRRSSMEAIFDDLAAAGIARSSLVSAWDFTVASRSNITGRLLAMRDDAFSQLGDDDMADGIVEGDAPAIHDVQTTNYVLCNSDGTPECDGSNQSDYSLRRVTGLIDVPCYMDPATEGVADALKVPCGPGGRLHYEGGSDLPSQNGDAIYQSRFTCIVPREEKFSTTMGTDKPGVLFGHGLLGDHTQVEQLRKFPGALDGVACGTSWIGMSSFGPSLGDLGGFLPTLLGRLDLFPALPDRSQQGMINMLYLGRAMASDAAHGGLGGLGGFMQSGESSLAANAVGFLGISQGGLFGGPTTAVAPDFERSVLGVPSMGFGTLLTRSTQFNQFLPIVYAAYPDPIDRQVGFSLLQMLWDRGEMSGYAQAATDDPLPGTRTHRILLQEAFGDHQVANVQTEALARTIDAVVRTPIVAPGRSLDVEPMWGIDRAPSSAFTGSGGYQGDAALFLFDTGPVRVEDYDGNGTQEVVGTNPNPLNNRAPIDALGLAPEKWFDGLDPHEPVATSPFAQRQIIEFLRDGGIPDPCLDAGTPVPCTAPPIHVVGEGL